MQKATAIRIESHQSCKEMRGATSVMPVIKGAFSQQEPDSTQWAHTIDWTVRCDWLQVASVVLAACKL